MRISELITRLQIELDAHGDVEVVNGDWAPVYLNFIASMNHVEVI